MTKKQARQQRQILAYKHTPLLVELKDVFDALLLFLALRSKYMIL